MIKVPSHQETEKMGTRLRRPLLKPLSPCSAIPVPLSLSHSNPRERAASDCPERSKSEIWGLGLSASRGSLSPQGPASGAAARAHGPLKKRRPAAHQRPGPSGSAPWAPASWPQRPWLGLASKRTKGTLAREELGAERRAPAFRLSATPSPEQRAASASYQRRRVLPLETPPAHRRGEGAAPTNWGAPRAARSGLCSEPPHPGRCAGLTAGPSETELLAAAPGSRAAVPRRPRWFPAGPGAPPWGPGSASGFYCCSPPFCSTRSAAGPLRRTDTDQLYYKLLTVTY
ncbi:hypothetical protein NN561_005134 [Cricetulus griseus]